MGNLVDRLVAAWLTYIATKCGYGVDYTVETYKSILEKVED